MFHPKSNGPSLDFLLDGGLIPSLPDIGGKVKHQELMGMGRGISRPPQPPQPPSNPIQPNRKIPQEPIYGLPYIQNPPPHIPPQRSSSNSSKSQGGGWQPGQITRSSSDKIHNNGGNVSSRGGYGSSRPRPSGGGHGQNHSISNIPPSQSNQSHNQIQHQNRNYNSPFEEYEERPKLLRRTSSFHQININNNTNTQLDDIPKSLIPGGENENKLHHSISDSAVHSKSNQISYPSKSMSTNDLNSQHYTTGIQLGDHNDTELINNLLDILNSLIPEERSLHSEIERNRNERVLNPFNLLIPLSIILEALVNERTILKQDDDEDQILSVLKLPILNNGLSLQLSSSESNHDNGYSHGYEINWKILNWYIESYNQILINLLPFFHDLQQNQNNNVDANVDEEEIILLNDLIKSIKVYINKLKKVFGEVAGLYVDQYSFIRGFWDETNMKDSAGRVGNWSDLFDL